MRTETSVDDSAPAADERTSFPEWLLVLDPHEWTLEAVGRESTPDGGGPAYAEAHGVRVFVDGLLFDRRRLERELALTFESGRSQADLVLAAYDRWGGEGAVTRLRGSFAVLICDQPRRMFLCARDQLGTHPLFRAAAGKTVFFSTSLRRLASEQGVSGEVNRAALADAFRDFYPDPEETVFTAVKRVPPGHWLRITDSGEESERYWDPAPPGVPVEWVQPDELERFEGLLDQAVDRCLGAGKTGILLSGGLDSVTVAAISTMRARVHGLPLPLALSLGFPDPDTDETEVQRAVASELRLEHVLMPFEDVVATRDLLHEALSLSRRRAQPLFNIWLPAYGPLMREGKRRGCEILLTGNGGDEWLTISPYYAADLFRSLDVAGFFSLWASYRRSFRLSHLALARNMLWRFGLRPLLGAYARKAAPDLMQRRRLDWLSKSTPGWLAPDEALRRELEARAARAVEPSDADGAYMREVRRGVSHALIAGEFEDRFETGRDVGIQELHPLLDPDLVDFLWRVPPKLLDRGGRAKGLIRETLARRFPDLGFDRQRKVNATNFFRQNILSEFDTALVQLGGIPRLSALGILDADAWEEAYERIRTREHRLAPRIWQVLSTEAWLQERS